MNMPRLPSSKPHEKVRTTYGTENLRLAPVTDNCLSRAAPEGLGRWLGGGKGSLNKHEDPSTPSRAPIKSIKSLAHKRVSLAPKPVVGAKIGRASELAGHSV